LETTWNIRPAFLQFSINQADIIGLVKEIKFICLCIHICRDIIIFNLVNRGKAKGAPAYRCQRKPLFSARRRPKCRKLRICGSNSARNVTETLASWKLIADRMDMTPEITRPNKIELLIGAQEWQTSIRRLIKSFAWSEADGFCSIDSDHGGSTPVVRWPMSDTRTECQIRAFQVTASDSGEEQTQIFAYNYLLPG